MNNNTKVGIALFFGVLSGLAPLALAISLWSWAISQVPQANEWAGLIKVVITLGMIFFGGAATIGIGVALFFLVTFIIAAICDAR